MASDSPAATIAIRGASTHNLRDVDLDLPRNQLIVFCGASGSGKTSMAIDTLYAEGQRRYIESFSAYTRQFLDQLDKPDVERIDGLPPAIAVTRSAGGRSNRTTVATATEVADHLRLLFARIGETTCPDCNLPVRQDSIEAIATAVAAELTQAGGTTKAMLGFEVDLSEEDAATHVAELIEAGYVRAVVNGVTESLTPELLGRLAPEGTLTVIADRLTAGKIDVARITESIEAVLEGGDGACVAFISQEDSRRESPSPVFGGGARGGGKNPCDGSPPPLTPPPKGEGDTPTLSIDGRTWHRLPFDTRFRCNPCGREFRLPEPQLFNFNSPLGACELCEGFGSVVETDMDLVVPDPSKTLREGAIAPWTTPAYEHEREELLALADDYNLPVEVPYRELSEEHIRMIVEGVPEREFGGLNGFFKWLERRKYKMHLRVFLSRWRSYRPCEACGGARLSPEALAVRVGGLNFAQLSAMEVRQAISWFSQLELPVSEQQIAQAILADVQARLQYLEEVGVGYLTLDRTLRTLSTGEAQRVGMTATLGSNLVDMLYVLDEPSAGLHPVDVGALTQAITRLRDRGNTVIVVDHEEETIRSADELVEFGPQSGVEGGQIIYQGPPNEVIHCRVSRTGDWLSGRRAIRSCASTRRSTKQGVITLQGARGANLADIDIEFPLGVLVVVTGVSGAGKSSLVRRTLFPALAERLQDKSSPAKEAKHEADRPLPYAQLLGSQQIDEVVLVDQQPIGRSPRSNPVTYIKAFDPIRALFAEQPDAQTHGFTASHFSFNVDGGRCETCKGAGHVEIDMQFLADIFMKCRDCEGRRYRREVLEVRYRGRDISEVLDMTALEAFRFFRGHKKVQAKLKSLVDVGLNYLQLGQPANTLSGGEAQRLKLAGRLATKQAARTLFILDEPTTGLHFSDVQQLIDCFGALLDVGHSLLVIEHNVQMMMGADWIIDLGPGAAANGGKIVVQGTPEKVAACKKSVTGQALAEAFQRRDTAAAALEAEEAELEDEP